MRLLLQMTVNPNPLAHILFQKLHSRIAWIWPVSISFTHLEITVIVPV